MANVVTKERISESLKTLTVASGPADTDMSTTYAEVVEAIDITEYDRATIQIRNVDNNYALTAQVFGSLYPSPSGVGTASPTVDSYWVQIGDDISIGTSSGALKTISTTGLKRLAVRIKSANNAHGNFPEDDCIIFLQGRV
tara:strand:+ start:781 stop:1203 length:423 start_codon:yes stop_codon:yes gene_type:complete